MPIAWEIYRHYKSKWWDDHTYEVIGSAKHSETGDILVVYKPLYSVVDGWLWDATLITRPLSMRDEEIMYNGSLVKRFTRIG